MKSRLPLGVVGLRVTEDQYHFGFVDKYQKTTFMPDWVFHPRIDERIETAQKIYLDANLNLLHK